MARGSLSRKMRCVNVCFILSPSASFVCVDWEDAAMMQRNKKGRSWRSHCASAGTCRKAKYFSMWLRKFVRHSSGEGSKAGEVDADDAGMAAVAPEERGDPELEAGGERESEAGWGAFNTRPAPNRETRPSSFPSSWAMRAMGLFLWALSARDELPGRQGLLRRWHLSQPWPPGLVTHLHLDTEQFRQACVRVRVNQYPT